MKIISAARVEKGMIVLRENFREGMPQEWVTGIIFWKEGDEPIMDSTEHLWGHYFPGDLNAAIADFKFRKARGY